MDGTLNWFAVRLASERIRCKAQLSVPFMVRVSVVANIYGKVAEALSDKRLGVKENFKSEVIAPLFVFESEVDFLCAVLSLGHYGGSWRTRPRKTT